MHREYGQISIHAPPRGATTAALHAAIAALFQFTPLREGRPFIFVAVFGLSHFNSRPSARGDWRLWRRLAALLFQFTPLREGRRKATKDKKTTRPFQFTPLREGRPADKAFPTDYAEISIHAPPRGATPAASRAASSQQISIHAPPRGATPTSPAAGPPRHISIHAPPRGATGSGRRVQRLPFHFNSRPSARGDSDCAAE